jgi:hypothetical protein
LPIPADPTGSERTDSEAQFRADLAAYLDSRFIDKLGELPEPTRVALMHELSERGPAWARLPKGWPQLPRRNLREAVATAVPPAAPAAEQLRRWQVEADRVADQLARQRRSGAVTEPRVAWPRPDVVEFWSVGEQNSTR